jgi:hypothetical protein
MTQEFLYFVTGFFHLNNDMEKKKNLSRLRLCAGTSFIKLANFSDWPDNETHKHVKSSKAKTRLLEHKL